MKMRLSIVSFCLVLSLSLNLKSFAEDGGSGEFEKHKTENLKEIDERVQKLQEHKSCVSSATNREAMKSCHEKMKEWRNSERAERLERRNARIDERIHKLQEKKNK